MGSMTAAFSSGSGTTRPDLHPVAARGFADSVEAYRKSRPSYPPDAVAWIIDALGIGPGRTVVDVGAGTGKFTALMVRSGARLIAVEPLDRMRAALTAELPGIEAVDGTAESLPMADSSADAIVAAQAFHWFDRPRALPEFARVLRPSGRLGVIRNDLDTSVDWVADFNAIVSPPRTVTPLPSTAAEGDLSPWFGERHGGTFTHTHMHDRASLMTRVESMSFVAVLASDERSAIFRRVAALIDGHPQLAGRETFALPYVCAVFWTERQS
jgi:SAM-dependent methyltransferase